MLRLLRISRSAYVLFFLLKIIPLILVLLPLIHSKCTILSGPIKGFGKNGKPEASGLGGPGTQVCLGGSGTQICLGGPGTQICLGGPGTQICLGGSGTQICLGGPGAERVCAYLPFV